MEMNMCANHPETPAVAYCRTCGKPLCEVCRNERLGAVYCAEHVPAGATTQAPPYSQPQPGSSASFSSSSYASGAYAPPPSPPPNPPYTSSPYGSGPASSGSPVLALILGMIPGVGAIYNGQYAKGLVHAVVFGLLATVLSSNEEGTLAPFVGMLLAAWWFYMVLEAYHTARKRRAGLPVDEFSSIVALRNHRGLPVGAIVLIGVGVLLLLETSGLVSIERIVRYWPAALILLGVYMLYARGNQRTNSAGVQQEWSDERR